MERIFQALMIVDFYGMAPWMNDVYYIREMYSIHNSTGS